jgi:alpha-L-fucosidase
MLFYDFSYPPEKGRDDWQSEKLLKMTRELQPHIVVNDRLDLLDVPGGWDYRTPEQFQPREGVKVDGKPVLWEACQTFSGSWGYHRDEATWRSVPQLIAMLIDVVSKGGNLLLNVGPTGRGEFDERALDRLSGMGAWMRRHGRSIYGCGPAPEGFLPPQNCQYTYDAAKRRLYCHILAWPIRHLHLEGMAGKVEYAQLLNDASEVKLRTQIAEEEYGAMKRRRDADLLTLELPVLKPNVTVPVVELFLK